MPTDTPMPASQRIVQVCLFLFAVIALSGGALQMYLGQPETTPRLDNVHRFLAGIYSVVVLEGQSEMELTPWTARVGDTEAVVELRVPTYAGAPGRILTLRVGGQ